MNTRLSTPAFVGRDYSQVQGQRTGKSSKSKAGLFDLAVGLDDSCAVASIYCRD
jgi:hypothetical protein